MSLSEEYAKRIYQYAEDHYNEGWDTLVECYAISEIQERVEGYLSTCSTYEEVLKEFADDEGVVMDDSKYRIRTWGVEPAETECFETLTEARESIRGWMEYYDGNDGGHGDYLHCQCIGFTLADIGCTRNPTDHCYPLWDDNWKE